MSDARERAQALILKLADRRNNPEDVLVAAITGMLTVTDAYKRAARVANEELEIAKRDIAILRKQRTEARKAAKVLASAQRNPVPPEYHEALRLALNYR
jgi:hypothetical protein